MHTYINKTGRGLWCKESHILGSGRGSNFLPLFPFLLYAHCHSDAPWTAQWDVSADLSSTIGTRLPEASRGPRPQLSMVRTSQEGADGWTEDQRDPMGRLWQERMCPVGYLTWKGHLRKLPGLLSELFLFLWGCCCDNPVTGKTHFWVATTCVSVCPEGSMVSSICTVGTRRRRSHEPLPHGPALPQWDWGGEGSPGLGGIPPHSPALVCHQTARLRRLRGSGALLGTQNKSLTRTFFQD